MSVSEEAVLESVVFLDHFSDLSDPRQLSKVIYPLDEILLLSLLAVVAGAETFTGIAEFGRLKPDLLRRFRPFANGTPDHDRIGEVFAALDAEHFQKCFVHWVAALTDIPEGVIAIDGKTSRRSGKKGGHNPIHMVSAFAAQQRLVLGQVKVEQKSNEIVAIPKLLEMLAIEGAIITIDAMGCQRDIASKIIDKKADYVLALKGNQGTLREDVELFSNEQKSSNFSDSTVSQHKSVDGDHGRIVTRNVTVFHDIGWLQQRHKWPGMKAIIMVDSETEIDAKVERETRFYITSSADGADKLGDVVRRHWSVESMHWLMDCVFRDDECRVRTDHAPANFTTIKHMAHNLLRRHPAKLSMTSKRLSAGWNEDFLVSIIK
ncbi:ISAs1 family transposase [Pseudaminobacter salicylatoxidans]|uniref:Putative transposase YbfD/YdcC n=1 Tax=Pseudaminobacter salicylatoxidans TaxID=93369 RepID=A0A316BMM0_PSESE|nr:ISAs1 family transposase [Pseudaminobacter salicylatoxidans]MCC0033916.1 ISAs1 family transposase [Hoeflea sp.]MCC0051781.1 ISAs1 family transposase [Rhodobiaceae bacterium]PWJ74126.1 putative transposase YbfD/YdcC [Pseudaminobacter salicylatoxidans]